MAVSVQCHECCPLCQLDFIERSSKDPFFLYMPFSHVHTTAGNQPQEQYASCKFQNTSARGVFGDALSEVDWIVGNVVAKLRSENIMKNTLILFTGGACAIRHTCLVLVLVLLLIQRCCGAKTMDLG